MTLIEQNSEKLQLIAFLIKQQYAKLKIAP